MVGAKMYSFKDFFTLISFCSIFWHGSTMVESINLTKSQGNRNWRAAKPIPFHIKNEKRSEKPAPGSEINPAAENILNYNPPLAKNRRPLARDHRIVKRNTSYIPRPTFKIPASFTLPPHIITPVFYPVCETEKSCSGRCTHNRTEWKTEAKLTCSCDPDCYEVFNDCCADYVKYCDDQKPQNVSTNRYKWSCKSLGILDNLYCTIADGIWMVSECSNDWPDDIIRTNCEKPLQKLTVSSPDHTKYLPVVSKYNITFRNVYCALCNKVNDLYQPWPLNIETTLIPPENYNLTQKIQFLLSNGATILDKGPKSSQPRRYCLNEQYVDSCASDKPSSLCRNGSTAIVWAGKNLKNLDCAYCNGFGINDISCFPIFRGKQCEFFTPKSFSLVLDYQRNNDNTKPEFSIAKQTCSNQDMVYDDILQVCRVNWLSPPDQNGQARFYVIAWLAPQLPDTTNDGFVSAEDIQRSFIGYLDVSSNQIFDVNISSILKPLTRFQILAEVEFFIVSSTIVLTPQQSLELLSTQRNSEDAASTRSRLLNFIYFKDPFVLNIKNLNYNTVKTTSRPITCSGRKLFTAEEYTLSDGGRVYINSTNTTYEKSQYFRENIQQLNGSSLGDNITVCEKYVPARCKSALVILAPKQFTTLRNLSIFHNETSSLYDYGQYDIFHNGSVAVCVTYELIPIIKTIRDDEVLGWITIIGFFLSILSLIFLLVTYILFPKLQTLPGKNLMNLTVTLLLFELSWVLSSFDNLRKSTSFCKALAVLSHYSLLAYFVSMCVIAFHTCKVFARQMVAPKPSKSHERKLFLFYSMFVWLVPAIFVIICIILDKEQIANVGYGDSELCYLSEEVGYLYFMTIPVAVLLLFNVVAFIVSVIYLHNHSQNTAAIQGSGARQSNISIYMKLSTLMGFSWLFAFLAYANYDAGPVFWYLFVILTSLQGVFVTVSFVINKKTLKLYRKSTHGSERSAGCSKTRTTTRSNLTAMSHHNYQDTKL